MNNQNYPGKLLKINITITLTVGFISLISSIILIIAYYGAKKEHRDVLTFMVATLAASAGITGTFYVGQSIKQSAESQELDRTLEYIKCWNNSEYLSIQKTAGQIFLLTRNQPVKEKEKIVREHLENSPDLRQEVVKILNFFEEMSLCINRRIVKEELLYDFYRGIIIGYCELFYIWIVESRHKKQNDRLYRNLTDVYEKWKKL